MEQARGRAVQRLLALQQAQRLLETPGRPGPLAAAGLLQHGVQALLQLGGETLRVVMYRGLGSLPVALQRWRQMGRIRLQLQHQLVGSRRFALVRARGQQVSAQQQRAQPTDTGRTQRQRSIHRLQRRCRILATGAGQRQADQIVGVGSACRLQGGKGRSGGVESASAQRLKAVAGQMCRAHGRIFVQASQRRASSRRCACVQGGVSPAPPIQRGHRHCSSSALTQASLAALCRWPTCRR